MDYPYWRQNDYQVWRRYRRAPTMSVFENPLYATWLSFEDTLDVMSDFPHDDPADCILRGARIRGLTLKYVMWKE